MLAFTHVLFGILFGLLARPYIGGDAIIYFTFVIIGSILPDIDHEGSTINKILPITKWFAKFFTHRGFFHTLFPVIILFFLVSYFSYPVVAAGLAVGYVAHIVSDGLTLAGVNLLHPFAQFRIQGFIRTGGMGETVTGAIVILFCILLII